MKRRKKHSRKAKGLSSNTPTRRRAKKGLFDNALSGQNLKNSAINTGLGALGGAGANIGYKLIQGFKMGAIGNIITGALIGFVASSMGAPKIGIGFTGGTTALALQGGILNDDNAEFADDDVLEEGEVYQTETGEYVRMLNDGEIEYLSEEEVNYLSEDEIYPQYSTMNTFQS